MDAERVAKMARAATSVDHVDLDAMDDTQLGDLIDHAQAKLRERVTSRLEEYRALANKVGFTVSIGRSGEGEGRRGRRPSMHPGGGESRGTVAPKYRNPDNPSQVWSGRGKPPRWMDEKLKAGTPKERFLIQ